MHLCGHKPSHIPTPTKLFLRVEPQNLTFGTFGTLTITTMDLRLFLVTRKKKKKEKKRTTLLYKTLFSYN